MKTFANRSTASRSAFASLVPVSRPVGLVRIVHASAETNARAPRNQRRLPAAAANGSPHSVPAARRRVPGTESAKWTGWTRGVESRRAKYDGTSA